MAIRDVTEYTDQDVYRLQQYLDTLGDQDDESVAPAEAVDLTAPGEYSVVLDVKTTLGATGDVQNYGLELTPIGQGPGGKGSARGKAKPGRYDGQIKWVGPFQLGQAYGVILRGVLGKLHATWFDKRNPTIKLATFVETGSTGGEGTLAAGLFIFRQH